MKNICLYLSSIVNEIYSTGIFVKGSEVPCKRDRKLHLKCSYFACNKGKSDIRDSQEAKFISFHIRLKIF